jgi:hypothetical protein
MGVGKLFSTFVAKFPSVFTLLRSQCIWFTTVKLYGISFQCTVMQEITGRGGVVT